MSWLPSWQAYSNIGPSVRIIGTTPPPRAGPRRRVRDRELVADLVLRDAGEALLDVPVLVRAPVVPPGDEVVGLDHQRVSLPAGARVAFRTDGSRPEWPGARRAA